MNLHIYKYPLIVADEQTVEMPIHSIPLAVAEQNHTLCIWARVDTDLKNSQFTISIRGTGHLLDGNEGDFLGTVVMSYGLVWHVFWKGQHA